MSAPLTKRERMKLERVAMRERNADERARSFDEVNLGFTAEMAKLEAMRCLECKQPKCIDGCPVGIEIDKFLRLVADGQIGAAAEVIQRDNLLPAICGRVCPQEKQCEGACVLAKKERPIAIGHLERYVADYVRNEGFEYVAETPAPTGKRVAVVGSGPAGLACAGDLIQSGHEVTVYEALHEPGGVLVYGIPQFRLPKEIVSAEIAGLETLGVRFEMNAIVGRTYTLDELLASNDAIFIAVGAGLPRFLEIPGENLIGVYSANEFLTRVNLMKAYLADNDTPVLDIKGKRVVVFGGGNTAMDGARTAQRLGAKKVRVLYRRTEEEMPARREEVRHAREEGVQFDFLVSPTELFGNDGVLTGVALQAMELGEPDESGRRRPQPIAGSVKAIDADLAVVAIGNGPNPLLLATVPDLGRTRWGTIAVDEETGRTSMPGIFAGGDIVTGGATVILAMGAGRTAAASIEDWLTSGEWDTTASASVE
ncbi:MAG: NADPH-dependent glutamate synthase [bacterium]|nr:NADPH-dependent glutamate synthase [bacterium]MCP4963621.1 NADPH-dependent glutamate synthase [bacterium]